MLIVGAAKVVPIPDKITVLPITTAIFRQFSFFTLILLRILRVLSGSFYAKCAGPNLVKNVENKLC